MSVVKVQGNPSGTGAFTIAAPATNTDRTLTLPDSTGTIATAESTLTQFNASGSAPVYACRAWVNFNGTGTVAIRGSGNVTSITDDGVGSYTVNFATAMPDVNYSVVCTSRMGSSQSAALVGLKDITAPTTSAVAIYTLTPSTGTADSVQVNVAVFR